MFSFLFAFLCLLLIMSDTESPVHTPDARGDPDNHTDKPPHQGPLVTIKCVHHDAKGTLLYEGETKKHVYYSGAPHMVDVTVKIEVQDMIATTARNVFFHLTKGGSEIWAASDVFGSVDIPTVPDSLWTALPAKWPSLRFSPIP